MSKTKLVPFDIEKAKNGAKIITRAGYPVRIKHFHGKIKPYTVIAFVEEGGKERTLCFTEIGQHVKCCKSKYDLFIEEEEETDNYDPYKATVESIDDMVEKYSELQTLEELKHFYNNVKVKCKEAIEYDKKWCKKQDEPKFQKGDWVIDNLDFVHQVAGVIENTTNNTYGYDMVGDGSYFTEKDIRCWTIQEAKDGDVLAVNNEVFIYAHKKQMYPIAVAHCFVNSAGGFYLDGEFGYKEYEKISPATKEQRELLFQAIKEAGYEWDPVKKELKKIENEERSARMTNRELALWLRSCPEEFRECKYLPENTICYAFSYREDDADKPVEDFFAIRRNGGEWEEPLIEL